jgi:pyruvyltransferase
MDINFFRNLIGELKYQFIDDSINVLSFITKNYGDFYNSILIPKVLNQNIHIVDINLYRRLKLNILYHDKYFISGIGSIIHFTDRNMVVWGTGSIWYDSVPSSKPKEILAVRGKLTYQNLMNKGFKAPMIFGDPGLLIKKYSDPITNEKKYNLGIIPHNSEKHLKVIEQFKCIPDVKIIDIEDVNNFLPDLLSCRYIASSSLHGLIFSDSFQIPNIWISLSDKIFGGYFKYHDYYSSIYKSSIEYLRPLKIYSSTQYKEIFKNVSKKQIDLDLDILENQLIDYFC